MASAEKCDLVSVTSGSYSLTNKACSKYTSGVIDVVNVDEDEDDNKTYAIVEPITGTPLNTEVVNYSGRFVHRAHDGRCRGVPGRLRG